MLCLEIEAGAGMKRLDINFFGQVQGVGFRWTAVHAARQAGVNGWVRNEPDGSVRLVAEGREEQLDELLRLIRGRMSGLIREERTERGEAEGEFTSFEIRR